MNDDFDNFFDDQRPQQQPETPIYHTPEPKRPKTNAAVVISIVVSIVMCLVVLVNVLVLATLKQTIADEYASSLQASMKEQYSAAIGDALKNSDIVDDVVEQATKDAVTTLSSSVGVVANEQVAPSVARLYMYTSTTANTATDSYAGLATGFLITDTDSTGTTQRYIVTNAHCVRYEKATSRSSSGGFWGFGQTTTTYSWASYGTIVAMFENDDSLYKLEIVAYGSYTGDHLKAENDEPDLALLRVVGTQPSNSAHPSLKIAQSDAAIYRGMEVALVGNPQGVGETNSISVGTVSQTGITISSWGSGSFVMTDAAVNSGNSGGPMVNNLGTVVGVVESKLVSDGIENMGFALSVDTLRDFLTWATKSTNNQIGANITLSLK